MSDEALTSDPASDEDLELAKALDAYLADLEAGRPADVGLLMAEHPEIASRLRSALEVMHMADRVAGGLAPSLARETTTLAEGSRPSGRGARTTFREAASSRPGVLLRRSSGDPDFVVRPRADTQPARGAVPGRYQVFGEIARGGMGAVLQGRDVDLGRDLAIKVLLEPHRDDPSMVNRFIEEAQIGGQLQHPGVAPVYELGEFADHQPYFTMKLVRGRTLAALLKDRPGPAHELPRLLAIFEHVCLTVAYAHSRGVIHRDLKPSNVMVGSFGEVQVMDWGLAKVLKEGGAADERAGGEVAEAVVHTRRSGSSGDGSRAGSVLGTPAYMPPEQARGEIDRLDERCDVFGLGAILCEILTGLPPYAGASHAEVRGRAARGELADALARLGASGAGAELLDLARDCLAAEPSDRPRDAGEAARRMSAYTVGVQERLRAAELARAEAQARAESERTRRRLTVAFASSALGLILSVGGGGMWWAYDRQARAARVDAAFRGAEVLSAEAERAGDDVSKWTAASEAVKHLGPLLDEARDAATRTRASALIAAVNRGASEAAADRALLDRLVAIRAAVDEKPVQTDALYVATFRGRMIDPDGPSPEDAGRTIAGRPTPAALAMASALDAWAAVRREMGDRAGSGRVAAVARHADPDPWRNRLRAAMTETDRTARRDALRRLAKEAPPDGSAVSANLLGAALLETGDPAEAEAVLRPARDRLPGDVWLNVNLARTVKSLGRPEEAIRYYTAAQATRAEAAEELARALLDKGETDRAIDVYRDLTRRQPDDASHHFSLCLALRSRGRSGEADKALEDAIAVARRMSRLKPDDAEPRYHLGNALQAKGDLDGAVAEYRHSIRLKPDLAASSHNNLGNALGDMGNLDGAIVEYRQAIRLKPYLAEAHNNLGVVLRTKGDLDGAVAEFRQAVRLAPDLASPHTNLGSALRDMGDLDRAIGEYRLAVRLKPDDAVCRNNLGYALESKGDGAGAILEYRRAIQLKPDLALAYKNLGNVLRATGDPGAAVAEYRHSIRLDPDDSEAHNNLGNALRDMGDLDAAVAEYRRSIQLKPDGAAVHNNLGNALMDKGDRDGAIAEYRHSIRLKPDDAEAHNGLGNALNAKGDLDGAVAEYRLAIRIEPDHFWAHNGLGNALRARGDEDGGIAEIRRAIQIKPDLAEAHNNLGIALRARGDIDGAVAEYRRAIRLKPALAELHRNLGIALEAQGKLEDARTAFRRAGELAMPGTPMALEMPRKISGLDRRIALVPRLPGVINGDEKAGEPAEVAEFAQLCYDKGLHAAAARLWGDAMSADSKLADDRQAQHRYNAACAAALAGCGKGKDEPTPDGVARSKLRRQALDWLRAERAAWATLLESGPPKAQPVVPTLMHWRKDPDLAGVRNAEALDRLPEEERKDWLALWADVDALLKKAEGTRR